MLELLAAAVIEGWDSLSPATQTGITRIGGGA
jgi:hypothetical protein